MCVDKYVYIGLGFELVCFATTMLVCRRDMIFILFNFSNLTTVRLIEVMGSGSPMHAAPQGIIAVNDVSGNIDMRLGIF